jgi:carboxypeptidase C (cathepsin A)
VTQTVGWKIDAHYEAMNNHVVELWHRDSDADEGAIQDLREATANDPELEVLIAHGWNDLTCPLMSSILIVDQMPAMDGRRRVNVHAYPGGHMFYTRPASNAALREDVKKLYGMR